MKTISPYIWVVIVLVISVFYSCKSNEPEEEPVSVELTFDQLDSIVSIRLGSAFNQGALLAGNKNTELQELFSKDLTLRFYQNEDFRPVWTNGEYPSFLADSLLSFITNARYYGLYPGQYHLTKIINLHERFRRDSAFRRNIPARTQLELYSTDAFFHILRDLKEGRIVPDSLSIIHQDNFLDSFFLPGLKELLEKKDLTGLFHSVEPTFFKYQELRAALPAFVDKMDPVSYPQIVYPFEDSLKFVEEVYSRISGQGFGTDSIYIPDASEFVRAIKKYQSENDLEADGKIGHATIKVLNRTDEQKFRNIAISLDRYKMLPEIPETFIWVNIPSFGLQVFLQDTNVLESKVIVGKPATPTPELTSAINNLVVYPNWTIPASIIKQEILPALKKNPDYLSQKGYNLFDEKGEIINPYGINWARYSSGIPWKVVQGSGDDNALGVFKFNFNNPYSVYLHDTNQRYLFANSNRALSHGCVRVQKWQQLADIIAVRDSTISPSVSISYSGDSIKTWVSKGVRKSVNVRNRFPLYIVYYTCDASEGKIRFYSDIYNEDSKLFTEYFMDKNEGGDLVL